MMPTHTMRIAGVPYEFKMLYGNFGFKVKNLDTGTERDFSPGENSRVSNAFNEMIRQRGRRNLKKAYERRINNSILYWVPVDLGNMQLEVVFVRKAKAKKYDYVGYGIFWRDKLSGKKRCQMQYHTELARKNRIMVIC